ncbi:hypothetical protein OC842_005292 [Tilletia horrida]|uniref:Uncharacterized protein n=1 Tax=Tilletia horrida TaxID=155126 RepID=A0AAN6JJ43_9BASI|nr:hypothetical protein OC842_005292 [Tilletia horrida]
MVLPAAFSTGSERPSDRIQEWRARTFRATGSNERPLAAALGQRRGHAHDPLWACYGIDLDYGPRVRLFFKWAKWRYQDRDWTHRPKWELIRFVEQVLELGLNDLPEAHNDMVRNTDEDGQVRACELHGKPPSTIGVSEKTDTTIWIPSPTPEPPAPPAAGPSGPDPAPSGSPPVAGHQRPDENVPEEEEDELLDELDENEAGAGVVGAGGDAEGGHDANGDANHGLADYNDDDDDDVDSVDTANTGGVDGSAGGGAAIHGGSGNVGDAHEEANGDSAGSIVGRAEGEQEPIVAESEHRFSPSLGAPSPSSSVIWIPDPRGQAPPPDAPAVLASTAQPSLACGPAEPHPSRPAVPRAATVSSEDNLPPATLALLGLCHPARPQSTVPTRALEASALAGPSRSAAVAADASSVSARRRHPAADVTSSPPPFRSVPSASSLTRLGVPTYFGQAMSFSQPASSSQRPQTPLRDTQIAAGPPRKRLKRSKGAPLKQSSGLSHD